MSVCPRSLSIFPYDLRTYLDERRKAKGEGLISSFFTFSKGHICCAGDSVYSATSVCLILVSSAKCSAKNAVYDSEDAQFIRYSRRESAE